jgi:hypothetical protein
MGSSQLRYQWTPARLKDLPSPRYCSIFSSMYFCVAWTQLALHTVSRERLNSIIWDLKMIYQYTLAMSEMVMPQASGRGGLQQQLRRVDSAAAFPTLRSGNQFDMPDESEEDEHQDERRGGRRSRTNSPAEVLVVLQAKLKALAATTRSSKENSRQLTCLTRWSSRNSGYIPARIGPVSS